jgi:dolichyl-diphosphooligosaccharide--protein glycosyltransferase
MEQDATQRDLPTDQRYVFSPWGQNRMYNYFVRGVSETYYYAEQEYGSFLRSTKPAVWADRLESRTGYIVIDESGVSGSLQSGSTFERLRDQVDRQDEHALSRYRLRYVSPSGDILVYTVVPGATIRTNGTVESVSTTVSVPGASFQYRRAVRGGNATVAYPGTYQVGDRTTTVSNRSVRRGEVVDLGE